MDSTEDEEDTDCQIDELLKALDGIEQCFIPDVVTGAQAVPPPSFSAKKRPVDLSPQHSLPSPKKIHLKDPRLEKAHKSSVPPPTSSLPLPRFAMRGNIEEYHSLNFKMPSSRKSTLKPIKISAQLSKYLKLEQSANVKSKQQRLLKNTCEVSNSLEKSRKHSSESSKVRGHERSPLKIRSNQLGKKPTSEEKLRLKNYIDLSCDISKEGKNLEVIENLPPLDNLNESETCTPNQLPSDAEKGGEVPRGFAKETESTTPPWLRTEEFPPIDEMSSTEQLPNVEKDGETPRQYVKETGSRTPPWIKMEEASLIYEQCSTEKLSDAEKNGEAPARSVRGTESRTPPWIKMKGAPLIHRATSPQLPSEILIKIFKYLPLSDKKNLKLVCKSWYDICNIKLFAIRQRFVCCGIYDTSSILRTLTNSGCSHFNLEFYRVHFSDLFKEYWKKLGPRIHALYFVDCVLGEESLGDVITHCTEMENLSFSFEHLKIPPLNLFQFTLFENLFKQRIVRPKLVNIDFQINANGWFSNAILSNLFAIYPNVTRLGFTCHSLDPVAHGTEAVPPSDITFSDLWSGKSLTFSPILQFTLSPPDSMEKLKLDVHTKGRRTAFAWPLVISYSKFTRLREIVIEIDLKKLSGQTVIEFCIAQPELKSVSCKIVGPAKLFISLFLSKLLNNCPRLRNLNVMYNGQFLMSSELFKELVASKLKSLSIESSEVLLASQITDNIDLPENEHLRSLSLSDEVGKNLNRLFVVIFRKLRFLEIHNLSDELLQLMWKFQTNLVSLKLAGVDECTIDGFCGVPENISSLSIRDLRNLEYLILEAVNNEWQVFGNVFSEFQFPKLKYLCVDIEGSTTLLEDLLEAVPRFTELEGVSITCQGVERAIWLNLNNNWKKLRYLRIVDKESDRFKVKQYEKFFKASPNLRAVFHEFKQSTESYYYDVIDKVVKRKTHRVKYRISSVKIERNPCRANTLVCCACCFRTRGCVLQKLLTLFSEILNVIFVIFFYWDRKRRSETSVKV